MPTFMCFLNWTDQAAKALKDAPKRYEATKALVTKLGGRLVCAYVTTGQYDVALVVEMPNGRLQLMVSSGQLSVSTESRIT